MRRCWFQIERQVVVTTSEKIAEVGRIDQKEVEPEADPVTEPETSSTMQPGLNPSEWTDDCRLVTRITSIRSTTITWRWIWLQLNLKQGSHEVLAGGMQFDNSTGMEEMHRPASYMVFDPTHF